MATSQLPPPFDAVWHQTREQVWLWCYRTAGNRDDAQDLFQKVALRAWRGYATFRGDASFLTWILVIARRVSADEFSKRTTRRQSETSLERLHEVAPSALPATPAPEIPAERSSWLVEAVQSALHEQELNESEASVLLIKLTYSDWNWEQIGGGLGLSANFCAVLHCRAIPKLRVYLFRHYLDKMGGKDAIIEAMVRACGDAQNALSEEEAEVFRHIILESQTNYRKAGWRLGLRSACGKIIKHMTLP